MSGTDDIDAVLDEWQGSLDAMRWAPDMDGEAIDDDMYTPTAADPPYRALGREITFGARYGGGGVFVNEGTAFYRSSPVERDEQIDLGFMGRPFTMGFPHHDENTCPVCQMIAQMAGLLGEAQSRRSEDSVREMMRIFSGERPAFRWDDEGSSQLRTYEITVDEALQDIRYGRADRIEDPVEKVAFLAVYGDKEPPGPVTVRNWRPRPPLRPLQRVWTPTWPTFAEMMRG